MQHMDLGKQHSCTPYCNIVIPGMHVCEVHSVPGSTRENIIEEYSHCCKKIIDVREEPDIKRRGPYVGLDGFNSNLSTHDKAWLMMFEPFDCEEK